jgi:hypothetical protein
VTLLRGFVGDTMIDWNCFMTFRLLQSVLGAEQEPMKSYLTDYEPYLTDPVAYPKVQVRLWVNVDVY